MVRSVVVVVSTGVELPGGWIGAVVVGISGTGAGVTGIGAVVLGISLCVVLVTVTVVLVSIVCNTVDPGS